MGRPTTESELNMTNDNDSADADTFIPASPPDCIRNFLKSLADESETEDQPCLD